MESSNLLDFQVRLAEKYLQEYVEDYNDSQLLWENTVISSIYVMVIVVVGTALSVGIACCNRFNPKDLLKRFANQIAVELTQSSK